MRPAYEVRKSTFSETTQILIAILKMCIAGIVEAFLPRLAAITRDDKLDKRIMLNSSLPIYLQLICNLMGASAAAWYNTSHGCTTRVIDPPIYKNYNHRTWPADPLNTVRTYQLNSNQYDHKPNNLQKQTAIKREFAINQQPGWTSGCCSRYRTASECDGVTSGSNSQDVWKALTLVVSYS